jgi:UDP-glucuronate 4-epimerase
MKILVTGGAGFIGSQLSEKLIGRGDEVICLDDFNDYYDPAIKRENISVLKDSPAFTLVEGDIRDYDLVRDLPEKHGVEAVVHLAARAGVRASIREPLLYEEVNCGGTVNLLEMAKDAEIKKFIFGSSSSVYGVGDSVPFSEDQRVDRPISPYAATKRAGELFCYNYHHLYGINIVCLRFFTVYGPRQRPEMAIHNFTRRIIDGEPIEVYGDGTTSRDYTYIGDIIDGVIKAIDCGISFEILNLGESTTIELQKLISIIEGATSRKAIIKRLPLQPGDVPRTYADITRARELIGYDPRTRIEDGVAEFVNWYRNYFGK